MRKVILKLELTPQEASMKGVRRKLGIQAKQIDAGFGVTPLRRDENLYAVRVDADVAESVRGERRLPRAGGDVRVTLVE